MYPLVRELAVDGIPVTVTCRVLKIARQPYYRWLADPVTDAEWIAGASGERAVRRPPRRPGVRLPVPGRRGPRRRRRRWLTGPRGGSARTTAGGRCSARSAAATARSASPARRPTTTSSQRDFTAAGAERPVAGRHHRALDRRGQALPLRDQGRALQPDRRLLDRLPDEVPPRRRRARQRRRPRAPTARRRRLHRALRPRVAISSTEVPPALTRHGMVGSMGQVGSAGDNAAMESLLLAAAEERPGPPALGHPRASCASPSSPGSNAPTTAAAGKPRSAD